MTLRRVVKDTTGQDVYLCRGCLDCDLSHVDEQDISLGSLVQMVIFDDEEVLTSRTLWSDKVLEDAGGACKRSLQLRDILVALRDVAKQRGLV